MPSSAGNRVSLWSLSGSKLNNGFTLLNQLGQIEQSGFVSSDPQMQINKHRNFTIFKDIITSTLCSYVPLLTRSFHYNLSPNMQHRIVLNDSYGRNLRNRQFIAAA
jgi:hypothetical protein